MTKRKHDKGIYRKLINNGCVGAGCGPVAGKRVTYVGTIDILVPMFDQIESCAFV